MFHIFYTFCKKVLDHFWKVWYIIAILVRIGEHTKVSNTVGVLFGGSYRPGALGNAWYTDVKDSYNAGYNAGFGKHENETAGDKFLNGSNGALNAGLRMVGSAAAIYNLATGTVKNTVNENALSFKVLD